MTIGVLWFGVYNVALNDGEQHVDAGTAAMLIQVSPVLIALLAAMFLDERFTLYLGLGLALAFGGVGLIGLSDSDGGDRDVLGVVLCLVVRGRLLDQPDPAEAAGRPAARDPRHLAGVHDRRGRLPAVRWASCVDETRDAPTSSILWVVYLGVFPTAIAFTTYAYALRHMTASSLGVTTYLVPPITIVMGLVFLDETPPAMAYVGGALALVGVAVARRKPRTLRHRRAAGGLAARLSAAMLRAVNVVANVLVGLVAALHLYFLVLEMFLWTKPTGHRTFGTDAGVRRGEQDAGRQPGPLQRLPGRRAWCGGWSPTLTTSQVFFLGCVIVAGAYGAATVSRRILFVQALPALLALGRRPARLAEPRPASSQPRNASRFAVDSPRSLRHSHSLRIEEAKPSSRIVLNDSSA